MWGLVYYFTYFPVISYVFTGINHRIALLLANLLLFLLGKDHVCRFIGCGRNDRFNYVVMQLQVSVSKHSMFARVFRFVSQVYMKI